MGSNFSQRKRLAEVMRQPIGHYHGWTLQLFCQPCREQRFVPVTQLLSHYAGHHTMQAVVVRLRCSLPSCRQSPALVKLIGPSDGRSGRPKQEVTLVGPGAY
jgi:hypothetical protein